MTRPPKAHGDDQALLIYQEVLDCLSKTLMQREYGQTSAYFNLPVQFRTQGADLVLESDEDLLLGYRHLMESLFAQGMTDILWLAARARWLSPDYIEGFHVSHYLRNAVSLVPPFQNRTVLRQVDGQWKVDEAESEVYNASWPVDQLKIEPGLDLVQSYTRFPREDARTSVSDPLAVYTRFLREYTAHNLSGDFESWADMHLYPHTTHTDTVDTTIKHREGVRAFFDMLSSIVAEHNVDRFERTPSKAEFLSSNKICGYHISTMYSGETLIMGPVKSRIILHRVGPTWFLRSVTNSVSNDQFPYERPKVSGDLVGLREIQSRRPS